MARGPDFNENVQIDSLHNVDIYHIACRILKLDPNPHATVNSLVNHTNLFHTTETNPRTTSSTFYCLSISKMMLKQKTKESSLRQSSIILTTDY